jgi:hypothetical protein
MGRQSRAGIAITPPASGRFKLGKYEIIAQPAPGSLHMLRYTVVLNGKRLGAQHSVPSESDC